MLTCSQLRTQETYLHYQAQNLFVIVVKNFKPPKSTLQTGIRLNFATYVLLFVCFILSHACERPCPGVGCQFGFSRPT